jgi:hypothetical protein
MIDFDLPSKERVDKPNIVKLKELELLKSSQIIFKASLFARLLVMLGITCDSSHCIYILESTSQNNWLRLHT